MKPYFFLLPALVSVSLIAEDYSERGEGGAPEESNLYERNEEGLDWIPHPHLLKPAVVE